MIVKRFNVESNGTTRILSVSIDKFKSKHQDEFFRFNYATAVTNGFHNDEFDLKKETLMLKGRLHKIQVLSLGGNPKNRFIISKMIYHNKMNDDIMWNLAHSYVKRELMTLGKSKNPVTKDYKITEFLLESEEDKQ